MSQSSKGNAETAPSPPGAGAKSWHNGDLFRLLVSAIRDYAIFLLDPQGRVTSWNAGAARIKGYQADEIIGRHYSCFFTPEEVAGGKPERLLKMAEERGWYEDEGWRVRKDGSRFWADAVVTALRDEAGQLRGFGKVTRDMTGRQQAELAVKQRSAELEAVNKELEAFCYSVSHDLRAPLRSIDGFSRILLEDYADRLDHTGQDYLRRVRASSQHMAQLIDDLLKLSRITRAEFSREPVDLSRMTREIASELHEAEPKRVVEWRIADGLIVQGDARLLRVAMENLLGNAWKFTEKRARATIELGASQDQGKLVYFVRDNGAGFDMAYVGKLFGAFQRLHQSQEFEGTGIGLATVQRIIHRHGGNVRAEGAVDKGATLFFTLEGSDTA